LIASHRADFVFPAGGQRVFFSCKLGQFFLRLGALLFAMRDLFPAQGFELDLQLHHPPANFVQLGGIESFSIRNRLAASSIRSIALSGQKPVGDVPIADNTAAETIALSVMRTP
jgi:hypothetical protein